MYKKQKNAKDKIKVKNFKKTLNKGDDIYDKKNSLGDI